MSENTTRGFASLFRRSADKSSVKKGVKFLPPQTNNKDGETAESKAKSQKEHRRAQVRRAQIEHRQRKENLVKHLEQDVIRLREMISRAENEATTMKHENESIKATLSRSNISTNSLSPTNFQSPQQNNSPSNFTTFQSPQIVQPTNLDLQSPLDSNWPSNSSSSVSIIFDDIIDASCLQVSPVDSLDNFTLLNSPDIFNFPANTFSQLPSTTSNAYQGLQKPLPELPGAKAPATMPNLQPDISSIAINFILALEHPCRTHFHSLPDEFDPIGDPTGHELMASTLLYSHAPASVFSKLDSASWTAPSLELRQLWEMSQSLPKEDFEITPVQAWFLISQSYEMEWILGNLDALKGCISKLVGCWSFGAVMDELKFWNAVGGIMGERKLA